MPEEEEPREQPRLQGLKRADLKITAVLWISLTLSSLFVLGLHDFLTEKVTQQIKDFVNILKYLFLLVINIMTIEKYFDFLI